MWQVYTLPTSASDFFNWEYETSQIFLQFKTFGMEFGHLKQKFELSNQNMCKKFLKNNAHIQYQMGWIVSPSQMKNALINIYSHRLILSFPSGSNNFSTSIKPFVFRDQIKKNKFFCLLVQTRQILTGKDLGTNIELRGQYIWLLQSNGLDI
jgi:hypothetical protein